MCTPQPHCCEVYHATKDIEDIHAIHYRTQESTKTLNSQILQHLVVNKLCDKNVNMAQVSLT